MKRTEVDRSKLAPMMSKYMEIRDNYDDNTILFFRLGDFYEMFFEDAEIVSRLLGLTLTGRQAGLPERVPMCGVPYHSYKSYASKLIDNGYKVAICEQLTDPKESKGMVERDVVQIITRGTIMDDYTGGDNNFIASIYTSSNVYAITIADISTGEIISSIAEDKESVYREIINHNIKEVIASSNTDREVLYTLKSLYNILVTITDKIEEYAEYEYIYKDVKDIRLIESIKHLLTYVTETKKSKLKYLKVASVTRESDYLLFDYHTKKNLELTETIRDNSRNNSLLWYLDKTKTAMGGRLLKENLVRPFKDKDKIERRYNYIDILLENFLVHENLSKYLNDIYDLERLTSRISYGNLNARDLLQLLKSLSILPSIKKELLSIKYDKELLTLDEIRDLLDKSINPDAPLTLKEGNLIKDGYNKELDELRLIKNNSREFILNQEIEEKKKTGIKNLKIGYNKVFGYYIEVSKSSLKDVKPEFGYIRKQTLTTGERFINNKLKEKERIILSAEEKIINLEYELFSDIRNEVLKHIKEIQEISDVLAELDVLVSLTTLADKYKLVRPTFNDNHEIKIIDGRHPVVDAVIGGDYVPNDIIMDSSCDCLLITGPNMAGKSTYMRQLAIIVIMAQIGSFVPCTSCNIPLFDKIFTRIGASDDLVSGESTFMVEMKEANYALQNATENSLILFDELGRGTATFDGMSLAYAILEYIHNEIHAKTLFSTHYHELTDLTKKLKKLKNVHVEAIEENGNITFLHKVVDGAVSKSYGINVASLAKLPNSVIDKASDILKTYETNSKETKKNTVQIVQTAFDFTPKEEDKNIKKIKELDVLNMTPMDALNFLYEIKKDLK